MGNLNICESTTLEHVGGIKFKKSEKFISLNIKYLVFVVYSIEYRLKRICKSLYFVFIYILRPNFIRIGSTPIPMKLELFKKTLLKTLFFLRIFTHFEYDYYSSSLQYLNYPQYPDFSAPISPICCS